MKCFLALCLIFSGWSDGAKACEFKEERPIISLSGPVSHLFYHLGLFQDKRLKALSLYHGFLPKDFSGTQVGGGLFLSPQFLKKFSRPVVFYDESYEQKKILGQISGGDLIAVATRGDPFAVTRGLSAKVEPFVKNCGKKWDELNAALDRIRGDLKKAPPIQPVLLFFLGKVEGGKRRPPVLMVHDGPVMFLLNEGKIRSYPTQLSYVTGADKIFARLGREGKVIKIGLLGERKEEAQDIYETRFLKEAAAGENIVNIYHPSVLIPGISQIYFMRDFMRWWTSDPFP